ncbi:MAG TPA: hypothetical protein VNZ57_14545 [Longimicrobiales bacterium]|nr:hypothetical protein [Longimicrobiales bacterium]
MAIVALIPQGTRVRVQRGKLPLAPGEIGRVGTVVDASEYSAHRYGVLLDGELELRYYTPEELVVIEGAGIPPDREAAKQRRALP